MGCMSSKILPDSKSPKEKNEKSPNIIRGDLSLKTESKLRREKSMRERMQRRAVDAEELSGKVMEEKERLSVGTWSQVTSRETSRTTSPVGARKQVHFLPEEKEDGKRRKGGKGKKKSKHNQVANGDISSVSVSEVDTTVVSCDQNEPIKSEESAANNQSKHTKDLNSNHERASLGTIEERTSSRTSRASEKQDYEIKRG